MQKIIFKSEHWPNERMCDINQMFECTQEKTLSPHIVIFHNDGQSGVSKFTNMSQKNVLRHLQTNHEEEFD